MDDAPAFVQISQHSANPTAVIRQLLEKRGKDQRVTEVTFGPGALSVFGFGVRK